MFLMIDPDKYRESTKELVREGMPLLQSEVENLYAISRKVAEKVTHILVPKSCYVDNRLILGFPNVKVIGTNSTTTNHINITNLSVSIKSLEGHFSLQKITSTAEHTLGLIMALHRNIKDAHGSVVHGNDWDRYRFSAPKMLSNMSLGIYGAGRVGMHLYARTMYLFDHVHYYDVNRADSYTEKGTLGCDVVSLHTNGNEQTFGVEQFNMMKPGSLFINTARAENLDYISLLENLNNGKLRGAAVDILPGEFDPHWPEISELLIDYASRPRSNLLITPHIAGSTEDAWEMTEHAIVKEMNDDKKRN